MKRLLGTLLVLLIFAVPSCAAEVAGTRGPQGEEPTAFTEVKVSDEQLKELQEKKLKVALLLHQTSDFTNALTAGARKTFADMGAEIVIETDAAFDASKQATDIETALAMQPDIIVTLIVDPVSGAVALKKAVDKGVKIVLISNLPQGFVHGRDYAGIVTDDLFAMGEAVAQMMGDALEGAGKVGLMFHDANYYVTNQRDQAVEAVLKREYPRIEIVDKKGIANPADGEVIASAMLTQFPDLKAIYAPWDTIAEGVLAACRAANRKDVKVFTIDLGANTALDLVKGGNMAGVVADLPFTMGETIARMGALACLGQETPPFVVVPPIKVDKDNILESWKQALNVDAPKEVQDALK